MDGPVEPDGNDPYDRNLEPRVSRVENDVRDVRDTLGDLKTIMARMDARLEATLPHLATKADVAKVESRLAAMEAALPYLATKADLAEKPGKTYMWGIIGVLLTAYACGLAALAILK